MSDLQDLFDNEPSAVPGVVRLGASKWGVMGSDAIYGNREQAEIAAKRLQSEHSTQPPPKTTGKAIQELAGQAMRAVTQEAVANAMPKHTVQQEGSRWHVMDPGGKVANSFASQERANEVAEVYNQVLAAPGNQPVPPAADVKTIRPLAPPAADVAGPQPASTVNATVQASAMTPSAQRVADQIYNAGGTVIEDIPTNVRGLANRSTMAAVGEQQAAQTPKRPNRRPPPREASPAPATPKPRPSDEPEDETARMRREVREDLAREHGWTPGFDPHAPGKVEREAGGETMGERIARRQAEAYPDEYHALPEKQKQQGEAAPVNVKKLSWRERKERLQTAGKLLTSEQVRAEILRKPGERDIVKESERRWAREQAAGIEGSEAPKVAAGASPTPPSDDGVKHGPDTYQKYRHRLSPAELLQHGMGRGENLLRLGREVWSRAGKFAGGDKGVVGRAKAVWQSFQDNMQTGDIDRRGGGGAAGGGGGGSNGSGGAAAAGGADDPLGGWLGGLGRGQMAQMARQAWRFSTSPLGKVVGTAGAVVGGVANVAGAVAGAVGDPNSKPLESLGNVASAGVGAGGAVIGGVLAGPIGAAIAKVVGDTVGKTVGALISAPEQIKAFGESLMQANEHLKVYNGTMQQTYARMELQQMQLDMRTARGTAGSNQRLGEAIMSLRDDLRPISQDWANVKNNIAAIAASVAGEAVKTGSSLIKLLEKTDVSVMVLKGIWNKLAESNEKPDTTAFGQFLVDMRSRWSKEPISGRPREKEKWL